MEPNHWQFVMPKLVAVLILCFCSVAIGQQAADAPAASPTFTPRPAFCTARTCTNTTACPNPAPGVATCDAGTGAWTVSGVLLINQITAQIQCQLTVTSDLKATALAEQISFGSCGHIVIGGVAELEQTGISVDFTGWDLSNLPVSVPQFTYKCVRSYVGRFGVSGLAIAGTCSEVAGSPTDYYTTIRQGGCLTYKIPVACPVPCSDVTCTNNVLCPQPFSNANCNSATGIWEVSGNLDTGATAASQRIGCAVQVSGSVTVSGTHIFGRCGKISTSGQTTINQGLSFTFDFANNGPVTPNLKFTLLEYGSVTGRFNSANVVNIEGIAGNVTLQYAPQKADTTYSFLTALASDPPIPQDISLSTGTGAQDCAALNCTNVAACPSPATGATCDRITGAWVVPAPFDTNSVTGEIGCQLSTQGNMAVGNSLTFGPCGKLVASGVLNIADTASLTFNLKGMAVNASTSIEFARYTSASGLFVPVAIQNMASSPTRYTPAPQKDNMVYRVLFYVEGTTAPPADISTNSPPPPSLDCSTITCANTQACPAPFRDATCQGGAWTLSAAISTSTAGNGQPINCAVNVNGKITVNSNLGFGVCGTLNTPNQMVVDSTAMLSFNLSGKTVQNGSEQVFASFSSASGRFGPTSLSNYVIQPTGANLDIVTQKRNSNYAVVFYTRGTPAPPTDTSDNSVSGTCSARSCADGSCPSPFPGAQCQAGRWTIDNLSLTAASSTIMCPVTVTGNAQISALLNLDGCGRLDVGGTLDVGAGASVSANLGGETFPALKLNDKFTFITFASSGNGTIQSVSIPATPSGSASGLKPALQKDSFNYYMLFIRETDPNPPEVVATGSPATTSGAPPGGNTPSSTGSNTPSTSGANPATSGASTTGANPTSGTATTGSTTGSTPSPGTTPGSTPGASTGSTPGSTPGTTPGSTTGSTPGSTPSSGATPGASTATTSGSAGNSTATAVTSGPEASGELAWWAWLLIAIAIVFVICIVLCLIVCLCKKAATEKV